MPTRRQDETLGKVSFIKAEENPRIPQVLKIAIMPEEIISRKYCSRIRPNFGGFAYLTFDFGHTLVTRPPAPTRCFPSDFCSLFVTLTCISPLHYLHCYIRCLCFGLYINIPHQFFVDAFMAETLMQTTSLAVSNFVL